MSEVLCSSAPSLPQVIPMSGVAFAQGCLLAPPLQALCLAHLPLDVHLASFLLPSKVPSSEKPSLTAWLERPPILPVDLFSLLPCPLVSCLSCSLECMFLSAGASAPSENVGGPGTVSRVFHSLPHGDIATSFNFGWSGVEIGVGRRDRGGDSSCGGPRALHQYSEIGTQPSSI